ncbi:hypothetical protein HK097_011045 [Rhizophlyctis rosea]|uniref:Pyridoxamine 5'-phosphate oxidase putative domain-containing protein n=1 Tax=Rhizophlyctis rosea TaxID=64517 RepID=A0AAD5S6U9_9FUNG|nr:hypothetical protein HK097_011045 [Rhizophlyctis rosea]
MTGSGVETIAHLRETSRITIMFIEIEEGAPLILRLFGTATVHEPTSPSFTKYIPSPADRVPGTRAVVSVDINLVTTACGWNVPIYNYVKPREKLVEWSQKMEEADEAGTPLDMKIHKYPGMDYYRKLKNSRSLDGLKGLDAVSDASSTLSRIAEWVGYKWRIGGGREATVGFAVGVGLTVGVAIGGRNFRKW